MWLPACHSRATEAARAPLGAGAAERPESCRSVGRAGRGAPGSPQLRGCGHSAMSNTPTQGESKGGFSGGRCCHGTCCLSLAAAPCCSFKISLGNWFFTLKVTLSVWKQRAQGSVWAGGEKKTSAVKPSAQFRRGRQPQAPGLCSLISKDGDADAGLRRSRVVLGGEGIPTPGRRSGLRGSILGGRMARLPSPAAACSPRRHSGHQHLTCSSFCSWQQPTGRGQDLLKQRCCIEWQVPHGSHHPPCPSHTPVGDGRPACPGPSESHHKHPKEPDFHVGPCTWLLHALHRVGSLLPACRRTPA